VDHGLFQLIAVGTPPDEDGSADLKYVLAVARSIGEHMTEYKVVITKSTVPVGTSDKVAAAVVETLEKRNASVEFDVVSNPNSSRKARPSRTSCARIEWWWEQITRA
jgi:UDPglucose 6-dehydrogenase